MKSGTKDRIVTSTFWRGYNDEAAFPHREHFKKRKVTHPNATEMFFTSLEETVSIAGAMDGHGNGHGKRCAPDPLPPQEEQEKVI